MIACELASITATVTPEGLFAKEPLVTVCHPGKRAFEPVMKLLFSG